jgi:hypothetical protein
MSTPEPTPSPIADTGSTPFRLDMRMAAIVVSALCLVVGLISIAYQLHLGGAVTATQLVIHTPFVLALLALHRPSTRWLVLLALVANALLALMGLLVVVGVAIGHRPGPLAVMLAVAVLFNAAPGIVNVVALVRFARRSGGTK